MPDAEIVSDLVSRVGFKVDLTALGTGMDKAKAKVKSIENSAKETSVKFRRSFESMVSAANLLKAAVAGAAVVAAKQAWDMSVELATFAQGASDVHDYFNTSFGSMAESARDWAESLADSYEIYEEDVEQYMGSLNQAFRTAGNSMSDSYEMAKDFTQLSYDLTRYYSDLSLEEIQSALTDLAGGEASGALKKLKISMSELEIKNKAVAMGIAEQGKELTAAQKQAVAYKVIMEQLGDAQGMYGESAANIGNAMTSLDASVKELKESIGTVLTPVVWGLSKVIKAAVDMVTGWIDDMTSKVDRFVNTIKSGINGVSNLLGFEDVFDSVDSATASTGALDSAMASLQKQAEETYNSVNKLAGFDRMYVLDTSSTSDSAGTTTGAYVAEDWEAATKEWVNLFETEPDKAVDALDDMWDTILNGSYSSVEDLRKQYGTFFDWMLREDLDNTNLSVEERAAIMDGFYTDLYSKVLDYKQRETDINAFFDDRINEYREAGDEESIRNMEALRDEYLVNLKDEYETTFSDMYADVLSETKYIDGEMAKSMEEAFSKRLDTVVSSYNTALNELRNLCSEIDSRIAEEKRKADELARQLAIQRAEAEAAAKAEAESSKTESKGFWQGLWDGMVEAGTEVVDQIRDYGSRPGLSLPRFAAGGVFEPNNPQAVIVGDNTREREVIAPETMIENAVTRALNRQGSSSSAPINIPITLTLDGRVLANVMYKYNQQEAARRGL